MRNSWAVDGNWLADHLSRFQHIQPHWHPLGFVSCFVLREDDHAVRVHLWPAGERRPKHPNWPIHTHIFDLESHVVFGALVDRQYELSPGEAFEKYGVHYNGIDSDIRPTRECVRVVKMREVTHSAGSTYSVAKGIFHETVVNREDTVLTVARCQAYDSGPAFVLGKKGTLPYAYERELFDREIFWKAVAELCFIQ